MKSILFIILLLFSISFYSQNQVPQQVEIPFTLTGNGHIIIPATVNGVTGNFVFDTGAGMNLLTKDFADKVLDLQKTNNFHTGHRATGEAIESDIWIANSMEIGSFKVEEEIFAVFDFNFPLDGLISLTAFENTPITIDFTNKILKIESQESFSEIIKQDHFTLPLIISKNKDVTLGIATKIKLDDKLTLTANLDSGAGFDVYRFNTRFMEHLNIDKDKVKNEYRASSFKPEEGNNYFFSKVNKISDLKQNVKVKDFSATFIEGMIHEAIMGINWISNIMTIDIPNKRLIVQQ